MKRNNQNLSSPFLAENIGKMLSEKSPFAIREAYSTCRTRLMFTQRGEEKPVFALTSPEPGDGKTITAINLAISFARAGKKTLLVDMDLRNASVHRYFAEHAGKSHGGLSEYLAGLKNEVEPLPCAYENLYILPAGFTPPNPAELLASERLPKVIKTLREQFDYIFIDTPPVNLVSDAALLADVCTGYIIVARVAKTKTSDLRKALNALNLVSGHISGILMNDSTGAGRHYSSYYNTRKSAYYYHGYYGSKRSSAENTAAKQIEERHAQETAAKEAEGKTE
ncbi:MAG: CpsD/CapB family tyrosine-protein kinase [Oscillospiraceae bacterium]|nr:CpsD/CapB family tyrosine-protein kinase [Oscillospiraceae bacterium]